MEHFSFVCLIGDLKSAGFAPVTQPLAVGMDSLPQRFVLLLPAQIFWCGG